MKLYAYEKEQNPVDYSVKRRQFAKNITPVLNELDSAIQEMGKGGDIDKVKSVYYPFNKTWVANERVVRNTSMAHYGKIETAMAMIRVGIENNPPNIAMMTDNMAMLKATIDSYNQGDELTEVKNDKVDLAYGVELLKQGLLDGGRTTQRQKMGHDRGGVGLVASLMGAWGRGYILNRPPRRGMPTLTNTWAWHYPQEAWQGCLAWRFCRCFGRGRRRCCFMQGFCQALP